MATSTGSTTDCLMIELKIATLDDTAEPNDERTHGNLSFMGAHIHFQATGARIRYLTRRGIAAPEAAVSSSSIVGRDALPVFPQDPMEFIHTLSMADFIPVHADFGPGPVRNIQSYDEFLTTTISTKSLGPCTVPFYHRDPGADEDSQIVRSLGNWTTDATLMWNSTSMGVRDGLQEARLSSHWMAWVSCYVLVPAQSEKQPENECMYTATYADGSFAALLFKLMHLFNRPTHPILSSAWDDGDMGIDATRIDLRVLYVVK
ncbi:hypothetical protein B0H14DRAFT_2614223 [Mycena olivaceomarginata]|nr:hypothetical protein B0H14DRAFT_2614223 [Mycena olivaceomarginata]